MNVCHNIVSLWETVPLYHDAPVNKIENKKNRPTVPSLEKINEYLASVL